MLQNFQQNLTIIISKCLTKFGVRFFVFSYDYVPVNGMMRGDEEEGGCGGKCGCEGSC